MRTALSISVTAATFFTLAAFAAHWKTVNQPDEKERLYRWFDSLGYDEVRTGQFVELSELPNVIFGRSDDRFAFLMHRAGSKFLARTVNLNKTGMETSALIENTRRECKPANFKLWAYGLLKDPKKGGQFRSGRYSDMEELTGLFVASRACAARGLDPLADRLFLLSKAEVPRVDSANNRDFLTCLKKGIADRAFDNAIADFGDLSISRKSLLSEFEFCERLYPPGSRPAEFRSDIATLRRMVKEDGNHRTLSQKELDSLPKSKQIGELIYLLRDQPGRQYDVPGAIEHLPPWKPDHSYASRLLAYGYGAVPQLIEAIGDPTFTRGIGVGHFGSTYCLSSVSEASLEILQRITGVAFYAKNSKQVARKWWRENGSKSEEKIMLDMVASGDYNGYAIAEPLVKKYPLLAIPAISAGLSRLKDTNGGVRMIWETRRIRTPEAKRFAYDLMLHNHDLAYRVAGARVYATWDADEAVSAMLHEYRRFGTPSLPYDTEGIEAFLAGSGRPTPLSTLLAHVNSDPESHKQFLSAFGAWPPSSAAWEGMYEFPTAAKQPQSAAERARFSEIAQAALAGEVKNETRNGNGTATLSGEQIDNLRVCDGAAEALARGWPSKYRFKLVRSSRTRDEEILSCLNTWLKGIHRAPVTQLHERRSQNLGAIVRQIIFNGAQPARAKQFVDQITAWRGSRFTTDRLMSAVRTWIKLGQKKNGGFAISVERNEYGEGFVITVSFEEKQSHGYGSGGWAVVNELTMGNMGYGGGTTIIDKSQDPINAIGLVPLQSALRKGPFQPIHYILEIVLSL